MMIDTNTFVTNLLLALLIAMPATIQAQDVLIENGDTLTYPPALSTLNQTSSTERTLTLDAAQNITIQIVSSFSTRVNLFDIQEDRFWTFVTVEVTENGQSLPNLTTSDFSVTEDGAPVCDLSVTSASQGGTGLADFVFAVDNSGSMGDDQAAIDASIADFVVALNASNIDFRLGLTRYGDGFNGRYSGEPILEDNGAFYTDGIFYRDNIWSRNIASGSFEPGYQAIVETVQGFTFRPAAQQVVIIVTDESLNQTNSLATSTEADALAALQNTGATLYAAVTSNLIQQAANLTGPTGGDVFPLRDPNQPWTDILNDITTTITNLYTIAFQPCAPFTTPVVPRDVDIVVNTPGGSASISDSYTPGGTPIGQRTPATAAITTVDAGLPLTLEVETADLVPPGVIGATLFYRTTGTTTFSNIPMTDTGGGVFSGTVPGNAVQPPGLDYYFTFTDGQTTESAPIGDPTGSPFQIGVRPNEAPVITHTNPSPVQPGTAVPLSADVTDDGAVTQVALFSREQGALSYTMLSMSNTGGDTYEASIPAVVVTERGAEYYIMATDNDGVSSFLGTPDFPLLLEVEGTMPPTPPVCSAINVGQQGPFLGTPYAYFTAEDPESGIRQLTYQLDNAEGFYDDGTGATQASGTVSFPSAVMGPLVIGAEKVNPNQRARIVVVVENGEGLTRTCDPVLTNVSGEQPGRFALEPNYPNPFNPSTTLSFSLPEAAFVTLEVYDVMGRRVATLVSAHAEAGRYEVAWNARNDAGQEVAGGVYLAKLTAGSYTETRQMTLLK